MLGMILELPVAYLLFELSLPVYCSFALWSWQAWTFYLSSISKILLDFVYVIIKDTSLLTSEIAKTEMDSFIETH